MGIRPIMTTIFGIDDLKTEKSKIIDTRLKKQWGNNWYENLFEAEIVNPPEFIKYRSYGKLPYVYEFFHWNYEFGIPSVMGLITSNILHDETCIRVLGMIDKKYLHAGYEIIPTEDEENMRIRSLFITADVLPMHFYQQGFYSDVPSWIESANYLFQFLGVEVRPEEMKWMLYWQWS